MDSQVDLSLGRQLRAVLASLLPDGERTRPEAAVLLCDPGDDAGEIMLGRLSRVMGLSAAERAAATLALLAEFDAALGTALAVLQGSGNHAGLQRPTLGLVARAVAELSALGAEAAGPNASTMAAIMQGPAAASGLLRFAEAPLPAHARTVSLPSALAAWLAGGEREDAGLSDALDLGPLHLRPLDVPSWPLPRVWREIARDALAADARVIVLRGAAAPEELEAVAAHLARGFGLGAVEVRCEADTPAEAASSLASCAAREGLVPLLAASRSLPVWHARTSPGSALRLPRLACWDAPWIVLAGSEGAVEAGADALEVDLPPPDAEDRLALWSAIAGVPDAGDRRIVAATQCAMGVLARAAHRAVQGEPAAAALSGAVRASARGLSAWAQISADRVPPSGWVGAPDVHRQLELLRARCAARADAAANLGPLLMGRLAPGVKALFIGASGTGKTLAAQWLADALGRPLVRVDLAAVVSKYIGETEKNLADLLSRAEHLDAVLLFDEADSLFGARTDVHQANDRYANMQTNYLLQRLESFRGMAVLTSNSKARFDDAFLRRLDALIEFRLPDAGERRDLWTLHLGDGHDIDPAQLDAVAALADLPGGHIRNAAITAALLARGRTDGDAAASVRRDDVLEALALEYRKLGQRPPDGLDRV